MDLLSIKKLARFSYLYLASMICSSCINQVILMEDSDHYDMFSSEERQELLFRIFQHLTLGGPLNQYEDEVGPYFDTVKAFYKSLVRCIIVLGEVNCQNNNV